MTTATPTTSDAGLDGDAGPDRDADLGDGDDFGSGIETVGSTSFCDGRGRGFDSCSDFGPS